MCLVVIKRNCCRVIILFEHSETVGIADDKKCFSAIIEVGSNNI